LRARWNWQRCQIAPGKTALRAARTRIWKAGVVVAGDEAHAAQAARHEAVEKAPPVNLRLRQRDGNSEHAALAVLVDARLQGLLALSLSGIG